MQRRMEDKEGGKGGWREAAVTPWGSLQSCSGLLEITQRREEDKDERDAEKM